MIDLPPDLNSLVRQRLAGGGYESEEEVLRAAMEALAERESAVLQSDKESMQRGFADLAAGRVRPAEKSVFSKRSEAVRTLKELRREIPQMTIEEINEAVRDSRDELS